jgi:NAD(P)-dependent dehydrogenase (short-subunit alcohol dehydrogenase family)
MRLRGLADKVAVVVGGATGLGAATAARLGEEGARVVIGDVAALVAFLLSEEGGWINGQVVNIDGGTVLR